MVEEFKTTTAALLSTEPGNGYACDAALERIETLFCESHEVRKLVRDHVYTSQKIIEGNIASGKSSLIPMIKRDGENAGHSIYTYMEEGFEPYLSQMNKDREKYASKVQTRMLFFCARGHAGAPPEGKGAFVDRSIYGNLVFSYAQIEDKTMNDEDFKIYYSDWELLARADELRRKRMTYVYLWSPAPQCFANMTTRDRDCELVNMLAYLEKIERFYLAQIVHLLISGTHRNLHVINYRYFANSGSLKSRIKVLPDTVEPENDPVYFEMWLYDLIRDRVRIVPETLVGTRVAYEEIYHAVCNLTATQRQSVFMSLVPTNIVRNGFDVDLSLFACSHCKRAGTPRISALTASSSSNDSLLQLSTKTADSDH